MQPSSARRPYRPELAAFHDRTVVLVRQSGARHSPVTSVIVLSPAASGFCGNRREAPTPAFWPPRRRAFEPVALRG